MIKDMIKDMTEEIKYLDEMFYIVAEDDCGEFLEVQK